MAQNPSASVGDAGDEGSSPGLGRSPGRSGNPLQCSCLEKSRGEPGRLVHRVGKSLT